MILDTEFLLSLDDQEQAAVEKAAELEASGAPLRVPTVVLQELYVGVGAGSESFTNDEDFLSVAGLAVELV